MTLTKAVLAESLCNEIGLNQRESKEMVEAFFNEIRKTLVMNEQVKLPGFGNFNLRDKVPRPGRNPKTGELVAISERRVVTFSPSDMLKDKVGQLK